MEITPLYPWLESYWQTSQRLLSLQRYPSASLFRYADGLGAEQLLDYTLLALLCTSAQNGFCGQCHHCQLMLADNHPDLHRIHPVVPNKTIQVDQIRLANQWARNSSQLNHHRIIVIEHAEYMTEAAANALLKTLEEPPASCYFVLHSAVGANLLPTILSRCQTFIIKPVAQASMRSWLAQQVDIQQSELNHQQVAAALHLSGYRPLLASHYLQSDIIRQYQNFVDRMSQYLSAPAAALTEFCQEMTVVEEDQVEGKPIWLFNLLRDLYKMHMGVISDSYTDTYQLQLQTLLASVPADLTYQQYQAFLKLQQKLQQVSSLNQPLLYAQWLLAFQSAPTYSYQI